MNEELAKSLKNLGREIGIFLSTLIVVGIVAVIAYKTYGAIATVYNLPILNYWVLYGVIYILKWVHTPQQHHEED